MKKVVPLREAVALIKPLQLMTLESVPPCGSLALWKSGRGVLSFYWRVTLDGRTDRYAIGLYDSSAPPKSISRTAKGFSLNAARAAAAAMAAKHYEARKEGGYRAVVAGEKAVEQARRDAAAAVGYTLDKLYGLYVEQLAERNSETAKQARNLFAKNVRLAFPGVAETQASKVTSGQIADVLRPLSSVGKRNTARKLKAYLSSAYERAKNPEQNATVSEELAKFKIKYNPVSDVAGVRQSHGADKNPLMPDEMRRYWRIIDVPGEEAALLRLHLMLGGQRIEQFVRMRNEHVQDDLITLIDTKGRSGTSRPIHLPRIPVIDEALKQLTPSGDFAITASPGRHLSPTTARVWAKRVVGDQLDGFELKRIRSGVATLLAKLGVSSEIRNHLQSHNLTGVEHRHYNKYDFYKEKKAALERMHKFLVSGR
ncbi:integrase [Burkholderia pseudomallei]|uniref:integrase n=1 Tax=Burkholderia pseudomallei TaxID=28450 RepID=UPI001A9F890A|nr:integrase [Burkholderia pseudomallei]QTB49361.1 integrase [Burkholderia pseudomallei]